MYDLVTLKRGIDSVEYIRSKNDETVDKRDKLKLPNITNNVNDQIVVMKFYNKQSDEGIANLLIKGLDKNKEKDKNVELNTKLKQSKLIVLEKEKEKPKRLVANKTKKTENKKIKLALKDGSKLPSSPIKKIKLCKY